MQSPYAGIGHNSREHGQFSGPAIDESKLRDVLHRLAAAYNTAAAHKRDATERLREIQRAEKERRAEFFRGLEAARVGAIKALKEEFRKRPDYRQAEEDKADASARQREATKEAKSLGVDHVALKTVLKMQTLDTVERKDHFDNVDIYAKLLGFWSEDA